MTDDTLTGLEIAIVAMAGRWPGAPDVESFWRNVCGGVESIATLDEADLLRAGVDRATLARPEYVRAQGVLDDVDLFDAELFGFTAREAAALDPQHRLFLECAWEALERGGYDPERAGRRVGVYAGSSLNGYLFRLFPDGARVESAADMSALLAIDKDFLATRVSYKLNLEGPSLAVQTACSTSLVAVHLACQALIGGECDAALAGGVSISVPQMVGYLYQEGAIGSPDGHCRAFDAEARGTVAGSGVGVVFLRRLTDALADGDPVVAVIKGSAINNDGRLKVGFTAPSVEGQARAIREAHRVADVDARSIGYVEAHGTGTPLGDPVEIAALTKAFRASSDATNHCAIGSVKTNIGHLDAAAGITGLIKAALAVRDARIPPSLHFRAPNPAIDFTASPFYVAASLREWRASEGPRRAGVSSFGIGGTNAHVVLEEPPLRPPTPVSAHEQLVVLSARSERALDRSARLLADALEAAPGLSLADVAHTLRVGRRTYPHRRAVVARTPRELASALVLPVRDPTSASPRTVAFLFPGQGSQHVGMARALYDTEPTFTRAIDDGASRLAPHLGFDLRRVIFAPPDDAAASAELLRTSVAQPALFLVEHALASLYMHWGVVPDALLGHSVGEYVAACLAGTIDYTDALELVAARGRLMESTPEGAMLGVAASEERVREWATDAVAIAAVNGPRQCVLSGTNAAIETVERELREAGIGTVRLRTTRAFHSAAMDGALEAFGALVARTTLKAPRIPFVSNVTGAFITETEARDPAYWVRHLRGTVRFGDGVAMLARTPERMFLEIGPGEALARLARASCDVSRVIASSPQPSSTRRDALDALGRLWVAGAVDLVRSPVHERPRVHLPPTPLERTRHWIDAPVRAARLEASDAERAAPSSTPGVHLYLPSWKRSAPVTDAPITPDDCFVVLGDDVPEVRDLVAHLARAGSRVIRVLSGRRFESRGLDSFAIRPEDRDDHRALYAALASVGAGARFVHAFALSPDPLSPFAPLDAASFARAQRLGSESVIALVSSLARRASARLVVLARGVAEVTGDEPLAPVHAPLVGVCRTVGLEHPALHCTLIDLPPATSSATPAMPRIAAEAMADGTTDALVALRGSHRWLPTVTHWEHAGRSSLLRDGGVYLVTGGLGALGLAVAEELAISSRAKLVLVGRSTPTPAQAARLAKIRALGAEVHVVYADVADVASMRAIVDDTERRFGALHGVVHAAGIAEGGLLAALDAAALERELAPKALGALAIDAALAGRTVDFVLYTSSVTAYSGGIAQGAYAAANAFLEAHAAATPGRLAIAFDRLVGDGMAARAEARLRAAGLGAIQLEGMTFADARAIVKRVLSVGAPPNLLVSRTALSDLPVDDDGARLAERLGLHGTPQSRSHEPAKDVDARLQAIWAGAFGLAKVDPSRDFHALGGESLLALQIVNRVREEFGVEISLRDFFERPTLAGLGALVGAAPASPRADEPDLVALPRRPRRLAQDGGER